MSEPAARTRMTLDEFLAFEGEGDTRYELVAGEPQAMAPPSDAHGTITGNAWGVVSHRLRDRPPCRAVVEAGILVDDLNLYVSDLAATCAETKHASCVEDPFLIVEVLSPSTHKDDLAVKVKRYIELVSVREIWLIDSRERWAQIWRREAGAWVVTMPLRGDATFRSEALGEEIALGELYRNSGM